MSSPGQGIQAHSFTFIKTNTKTASGKYCKHLLSSRTLSQRRELDARSKYSDSIFILLDNYFGEMPWATGQWFKPSLRLANFCRLRYTQHQIDFWGLAASRCWKAYFVWNGERSPSAVPVLHGSVSLVAITLRKVTTAPAAARERLSWRHACWLQTLRSPWEQWPNQAENDGTPWLERHDAMCAQPLDEPLLSQLSSIL